MVVAWKCSFKTILSLRSIFWTACCLYQLKTCQNQPFWNCAMEIIIFETFVLFKNRDQWLNLGGNALREASCICFIFSFKFGYHYRYIFCSTFILDYKVSLLIIYSPSIHLRHNTEHRGSFIEQDTHQQVDLTAKTCSVYLHRSLVSNKLDLHWNRIVSCHAMLVLLAIRTYI